MTQPSNQEKLKHPLCVRKQSPAHKSSYCCSTVTSQETEYNLLMQKGVVFHSCFYALPECILALLKSQPSALRACTLLFICVQLDFIRARQDNVFPILYQDHLHVQGAQIPPHVVINGIHK